MLTRLEGPWSGQVQGNPQGIARQGLHKRSGGLSTAVSVQQADQARGSLQEISFCPSIYL